MSSTLKCSAAGFLGSQWPMNSGQLASRGGAAMINKVGMINGALHKFLTTILAVKKPHLARSFSKFTLLKIKGRKLVCLVTLHKCWQLAVDSHHIDLDRNM